MPTENKLALKRQRAEQVNQVIRIITDHGRQFFYRQTVNRYANMEVDHRSKVWFIDDYSGTRIFTHETVWGGKWRGFSHGGTLRDLVKELGITSALVNHSTPDYLGPERIDDSNIWGYDEEAMKAVRKQVSALPVFSQLQQAAA